MKGRPTILTLALAVLTTGCAPKKDLEAARAELAACDEETAKLEAQAYPLRLMIEQQVREAYLDAVRAREDVEVGRRALRASENLIRAELQTFDIGLGGIEDVIDAFKANVGMTLAQFQNIATLNSRIAELSQRVGMEIG